MAMMAVKMKIIMMMMMMALMTVIAKNTFPFHHLRLLPSSSWTSIGRSASTCLKCLYILQGLVLLWKTLTPGSTTIMTSCPPPPWSPVCSTISTMRDRNSRNSVFDMLLRMLHWLSIIVLERNVVSEKKRFNLGKPSTTTKRIFFPFRGYPPPPHPFPLNGKSFCPKKLSRVGGNEKNQLSSNWRPPFY